MIPDQGKPMAIKALIQFKNGIYYWSDVLSGLSFPFNRPHVQLYHCTNVPKPFWSRDNQLRKAEFELSADLSKIENVELHVRNWDGGEGTIKEPFKLFSPFFRNLQCDRIGKKLLKKLLKVFG